MMMALFNLGHLRGLEIEAERSILMTEEKATTHDPHRRKM